MGASCKPAEFYFVYLRNNDYVHMVNAASLRSALTALNVLPHMYTILGTYPNIHEAHERITHERHAYLR